MSSHYEKPTDRPLTAHEQALGVFLFTRCDHDGCEKHASVLHASGNYCYDHVRREGVRA